VSLAEVGQLAGSLAAFEARSTGEQIAERLVTAIALGEFVPGQRLPSERALSAQLEVSRKSVREALHSLEERGYVEIVHGRRGGAVVTQEWLPASQEIVRRTLAENWETFEQLFDLRHLVEPLIARTAAERRTDDELARIAAACTAYDEAPDRSASRAGDADLHGAIADATHNAYLGQLSRQIRAQVSLGFSSEPYTDEIRRNAIVHHHELVDAIEQRDGARAAAVAAKHFMLTEDALRRLAGRVEVGR
jgi:DNA-binding FadR family transcriptional regulator